MDIWDNLKKQWKKLPNVQQASIAGGTILLILILGGIFWYQKAYTEPNRTFWAMINNNLSTAGITKQEGQNNQNVDIKTLTQVSFSPVVQLHSYRKITDNTTTPSSKLTLETIATPEKDYQRYSHIDRATQNGKRVDYSRVYPIWLLASSDARKAQQLNSSLFEPILFGNLSSTARQQVAAKLASAYKPVFIKTTNVGGRQIYSYKTDLYMRAYAEGVKQYAKVMGLASADGIDPSIYPKDAKVSLLIDVDVLARQVVKMQNTEQTGSTELYFSYGISNPQNAPAKIYSVADLQKAIEAASQ